MDLSWNLALAALVAIEAIREVPPGASHVLWRAPGGTWRITVLRARFGRMWSWPCLIGGDVIALGDTIGANEEQERHSDDNSCIAPPWWTMVPNILAAFTSALIVVGLPTAAYRFGLLGLVLATCLVLDLWLLTCVATTAVDHVGQPVSIGRPSARIRLCSPFAVLILSGLRTERRLSGQSASGVIRSLLDPVTLQGFVRPTWYDMRNSSIELPRTLPSAVLASMTPEEQADLLMRAPDGAAVGERYCPRCGSVFQSTVSACSDCHEAPALILA
jgi:hypothetical protein